MLTSPRSLTALPLIPLMYWGSGLMTRALHLGLLSKGAPWAFRCHELRDGRKNSSRNVVRKDPQGPLPGKMARTTHSLLHTLMLAQNRLGRWRKGRMGSPLLVGARWMVGPESLQVWQCLVPGGPVSGSRDALETGPAHACQLAPQEPPALDRQWPVPKHKSCRHSTWPLWLLLQGSSLLLLSSQGWTDIETEVGSVERRQEERQAGWAASSLTHNPPLQTLSSQPSPLLIAPNPESSEAALLVWDGGH